MAGGFENLHVHTLGHSTHTLDELVTMLRAFGIQTLVDIRSYPRSRHNPQFNADTLGPALEAKRIGYARIAELGGRRRTHNDSPNLGFRSDAFRGFADYMQTASFEEGLTKLREFAAAGAVAIMCAEAVPWRCHRSLVSDALVARGAEVTHITGPTHSFPHRLTSFARLSGTRVTYPSPASPEVPLSVRGPFHLQATVRVLQRRPTNAVDGWFDAKYVRALLLASGPTVVTVEDHGTIDAPDLRLTTQREVSEPELANVTDAVRRVLGLDVDQEDVTLPPRVSRSIAEICAALRGMRPPRFASLFQAFANVIPFQQVSLDAGVAVTSRIVERFGTETSVGAQKAFVFPTAERIAEARLESLRRCGLSHRKSEALRSVARAIASGELEEEALASLSTEEALRTLVALPGIGPWSANLLLLRGLGRLDVFPPGDAGAKRGLGRLLGTTTGEQLARLVDRCGPHRGMLYFYGLGASLLAKGLIAPAPPP